MVTSVQSRAQQNVDPSKTSTDLLSSWLCWPLLKNWHRIHHLGTLSLGFGWNHHIQVSYLNLETTNFFLSSGQCVHLFCLLKFDRMFTCSMKWVSCNIALVQFPCSVRCLLYIFLFFKFRWDFHILQQADQRKQEGDHTARCPVISTYHRGS